MKDVTKLPKDVISAACIAKKNKTLIIIDWDDTIMPTTQMVSAEYIKDDMEVVDYAMHLNLEKTMQFYERDVLKVCKQLYDLCGSNMLIVTSAEEGWVQQSGRKFIRKVVDWLEKNKIRIISARKRYEKMFPNEPEKWKARTFLCEAKRIFKGINDFTLISIGDSEYEAIAAHVVNMAVETSFVKAIKLEEKPNVITLTDQLETIVLHIESIIAEEASTDHEWFMRW